MSIAREDRFSGFNNDAVWVQKTQSGFRQQVFVVYHSTKTAIQATSILTNGFFPSKAERCMLGAGVYVSKDLSKTLVYGPITFRMLMYPGRVRVIKRKDDPWLKSWQKEYDAAWVPPNCGMVESGLEETCVRSADQLHILGMCRGWNLLGSSAANLTRNQTNRNDNLLTDYERQDLSAFLARQGLEYKRLLNFTRRLFLADEETSDGPIWLRPIPKMLCAGDETRWLKTWDNCLENKMTGRVLTLHEGRLRMVKYYESSSDKKLYKWRLDLQGALIHEASNRPLIVDKDEPLVPIFGHVGSGQFDKFRLVCSARSIRNCQLFTVAIIVFLVYVTSLIVINVDISWRYFLGAAACIIVLAILVQRCCRRNSAVAVPLLRNGYESI